MRLLRWFAGFFEVQASQSMSRLLAFFCVAIAAVLVGFTGRYVLHSPAPSATVITALLGAVAMLIGGGAVALVTRTPSDPPPPSNS